MSFTANPKSNLAKFSLIAVAALVISPSVGFALDGKAASEERAARLKIEKQESEARVAKLRSEKEVSDLRVQKLASEKRNSELRLAKEASEKRASEARMQKLQAKHH